MSAAIVETKYGRLRGKEENGIYVWRGIPYAAPPIHSFRFRAPVPPASWTGIRDATQFGNGSLQRPSPFSKILGEKHVTVSEDCLYLNIWTPGADDKRRPVMVWIHGGGFVQDFGSSPWYDGSSFAKMGDIVFVSINYRLGAFGFLHLAEIGGESYEASGNCGLLDQVEALKWVKENIEAFGGDPARVTICGESAGATSVALLMTMPSAQGLFSQAILQSCAADLYSDSAKATGIAERILQILNVEPGDLSRLETIAADQILDAADQIKMSQPKTTVFSPVIDGKYLPFEPLQAFEKGVASRVPIIIGTTKDEYGLHAAISPSLRESDEQQVEQVIRSYIGSLWSELSSYYLEGATSNRQILHPMVSALSAFRFTIPAIQLSEEHAKHGANVWMYRFDWESPMFGGKLGACHFLEIPFVFHHFDHPDAIALTGNSAHRARLADQMNQAWIAFVRTGNPNTSAIPEWPSYDINRRSTMLFHVNSEIVHDPNREERLAWAKAISKTMEVKTEGGACNMYRSEMVQIGEGKVHVQIAGSGDPLVWIKGEMMLPEEAPFFQELAKKYQLYLVESPGFGSSEKIDWIREAADYNYFYREFLDHYKLDRVHLAGHSIGGRIALEFAISHPNRVKKLLLFAPQGAYVAGAKVPNYFLGYTPYKAELIWHDRKLVRDMIERKMSDEEVIRHENNELALCRLIWERNYNPKFPTLLKYVAAPTCIVWGKEDRLYPAAHGEFFNKHIPNAWLHVIEDAGHVPFIEKEGECVEIITDFLANNVPEEVKQ